MKLKKNVLKLSILAALVCCLLVAGTFLAAGSAAPAAVDESKLNLMLTVSTDKAVAAGETFTATVKVANQSVKEFKIAGLQVFLNFDNNVTTTEDKVVSALGSESAVAKNVVDQQVRFVCVKEEFTEDIGYESLGELFTVTFTAKATIDNPAKLFDNTNIEFVVGDTEALKIENVGAIYGANAGALANAIISDLLEIKPTSTVGTVLIAPTTTTEALTVANFEKMVSGATITSNDGVIGTGAIITVDGKETRIVVKGDVDGDGIVTVFDAQIILNGDFTEKDLEKFAGDADGDGKVKPEDVLAWLKTIVGKN